MHEKKRPEKILPISEIKPSVTEVLVANGRSFEPFVRTFSYTGENITRSSLGTLLGVFEIDDQHEDSAYIVNFLASVAKKEYFNNPRRGAIESFEAALHKMNLALAELVKHGNITWLGKFHGAIGVLEKNNLHFSVTGHAKILLLRNDILADISEGLASEESHIHPIKTFVEVSSGRLTPHDQILLSSPELLALFSLDDLSKTATRMDHGRFTQFLKTALVNEIDMAGLVVVDIETQDLSPKPPVSSKESPKPEPVRINNVFSQSAFVEKKPSETPSVLEALTEKKREEEYIDTKTGHIYVQGETLETPRHHAFLEEWRLALEEKLHLLPSFLSAQGKWFRKGKKQLVLLGIALGGQWKNWSKKMGRAVRRQWRKQTIKIQERKEAHLLTQVTQNTLVSSVPTSPQTLSEEKKQENKAAVETPKIDQTPLVHQNEEDLAALPDFIQKKLTLFYQKQKSTQDQSEQLEEKHAFLHDGLTIPRKVFSRTTTFFASIPLARWKQMIITSITTLLKFSQKSLRTFQSLPPRARQALYGMLTGLIVSLVLFSLFSKQTPTTDNTFSPSENTPSSEGGGENQRNANTLNFTTLLDHLSDTIINSLIVKNEIYVITEKSIILLQNKAIIPLPSGSTARFASVMDDLGLIFIITSDNQLIAFSPTNKTFTTNTLPLEQNVRIKSIGTYLTYLYILDSTTNQIYRFPRVPGGFGNGTPWLKETVTIEENAHMTVNETLFLSPTTNTLMSYFRGRKTNTFEVPENGLDITNLYSHPGIANVYALDQRHQSLFIWNQEGALIATYTDPIFSQGTTLSVNEKSNEVFIGTDTSLFSFTLKELP